MPDQDGNPGTDEDTDVVVELDDSVKSDDGSQVIPEVSRETAEVETPEEESKVAQLQERLAKQKETSEQRIGKLLQANDERLKGVKTEYTQYANDLQEWAGQQVKSMQDYYENILETELSSDRLAEHYRKIRKLEREASDQTRRVAAQRVEPTMEPSKEPEHTESPELTERLSKLEAELAATRKQLAEVEKEPYKVTGGGSGGGPKGPKPVSARDQELQDLIAAKESAEQAGHMGEAITLKGRIALLKAQR